MTESDSLKAIADECRECARIYAERPGLAGGANAGMVCDLYMTLARLADTIAHRADAEAIPNGGKDGQ